MDIIYFKQTELKSAKLMHLIVYKFSRVLLKIILFLQNNAKIRQILKKHITAIF